MIKELKLYTGAIFILVMFSFLVGFSRLPFTLPNNDNVNLVIDSKSFNELPKNFRKTTDTIKDSILYNLYGLADLNASGSAQFSENGLALLKQSIGSKFPIKIVDLRQESHGFVNGLAVSWEDKNNKANSGLTRKQVLNDEHMKLNSISLGEPTTVLYNKNYEVIIPSKVQDEEGLVNNQGMSYIRIPVTDGERPTDDMVNFFIQFVKTAQPNTWLHFHCKAGVGRTTMFMVMYDSMKNAKKVSLDDIMNRQVSLGGENLLNQEYSSPEAKRRAEFIRDFYKYCVNNKDNFKTSWSKWIENKKAAPLRRFEV